MVAGNERNRRADDTLERQRSDASADDWVADEESGPAGGTSKSARKREAEALKDFAMQLAALSERQLGELALNEKLRAGIDDYRRIRSNGARRRQRQYLGGLLRALDADTLATLKEQYARATEHDAHAKREHHALEQWRERLIDDDSALTDFLDTYPQASAQELRTLIRKARDAARKPGGDDKARRTAGRALFRKLASIAQT